MTAFSMASYKNHNGRDSWNTDIAKDYSTSDLTVEVLSKVLINHLTNLRPGLIRFHKNTEEQLSVHSDHVNNAVTFANTMMLTEKIGRQSALGFAVLTVYDIVMLVGKHLAHLFYCWCHQVYGS
jgi:hypothetical protein